MRTSRLMAPLVALVLASGALSLAAPDFTSANVSEETARFCSEHLATELTTRGVRVITSREIASIIGLERQRQLLGCGESSSSCMAELSDALGVDGVLLGDLGHVGKRYQLNVRVVRAGGTAVITSLSLPIGSEDDLLPMLTRAADELSIALKKKLGRPDAPSVIEVAATADRVHPWPVWPTVLAGVFLAGAVGCDLWANAEYQRLVTPSMTPLDPKDATAGHDRGLVARGLGWVGYGLSAVSLGVAAFIAIRGEPAQVQPVAFVSASGGVVGLSGVFP